MRIVKNGDVHVSAPYGMPQQEIEAFVEQHRDWIDKARQKTAERQKRQDEFFKGLRLDTAVLFDLALFEGKLSQQAEEERVFVGRQDVVRLEEAEGEGARRFLPLRREVIDHFVHEVREVFSDRLRHLLLKFFRGEFGG